MPSFPDHRQVPTSTGTLCCDDVIEISLPGDPKSPQGEESVLLILSALPEWALGSSTRLQEEEPLPSEVSSEAETTTAPWRFNKQTNRKL